MTEPLRVRFGAFVRWLHLVVGVAFTVLALTTRSGPVDYVPGALLLLRAAWMWLLPYVEVRGDLVLVRDGYLLPRVRRTTVEPSEQLYVEGRRLRVWPGGREIADLRWCGTIDLPDRATLLYRIVDDHRSIAP